MSKCEQQIKSFRMFLGVSLTLCRHVPPLTVTVSTSVTISSTPPHPPQWMRRKSETSVDLSKITKLLHLTAKTAHLAILTLSSFGTHTPVSVGDGCKTPCNLSLSQLQLTLLAHYFASWTTRRNSHGTSTTFRALVENSLTPEFPVIFFAEDLILAAG